MIIRVVDFETTGAVPPAEVIEVGTCDLVGPPWEVSQPTSYLCGSSQPDMDADLAWNASRELKRRASEAGQ